MERGPLKPPSAEGNSGRAKLARRLGILAIPLLALTLGACTRMMTNEPGAAPTKWDSVEASATATFQASQDVPAYQGGWEAKAHFNGGGSASYARGQFDVNAPSTYNGYYGAAFYLPPGTLTGSQPNQKSPIDIMRWDNQRTYGQNGDYGGISIGADHRARLVRGQFSGGTADTIGQPFTLQEGCWNWVAVHQRLSATSGQNEVYVNGTKVVDSNAANNFGRGADQLRFGLASVDGSIQDTPLDVYVDNAYVSNDQVLPVGANACKPRPNILFIVTDDQHPTDTVTNQVMPHTVRLFADQGTFFPNAFGTTPVCCPARTTMLTGQYAHNTNVHGNEDAGKLDQSHSLQAYLHQSGYETGLFGKFLNDWNLWKGPNPDGATYWDKWAILNGGFEAPNDVNEQGVRKSVNQYSTTYVQDQALQFLQDADQQQTDGKPWFMVLAPYAPHTPYTPDAQYANAAVPDPAPNPAYDEGQPGGDPISDKPPYVRTWDNTEDIFGPTGARAQQLRSLMSVDDMVQNVFQTLDNEGEDRDTLAFFITDNGVMWGEHGLNKKGQPYTESVGIPFYMRWLGNSKVQQAGTDSRLVGNVDMAPTVMDALGLSPTTPMDGQTLFDKNLSRNRILLEWWGRTKTPPWASIRTKDYQYVEYYGDDRAIVTYREYYDLRNDPYQLTNLLGDGDPSNDPPQSTLDALAAQLRADKLCAGDTCPPFGNGANPAVDTTPPHISITTPAANATVGGTVDLEADAADNVGVSSVQFQIDGKTVAEDTEWPYSQGWDSSSVSAGTHTLKAVARDAEDNVATAQQTITVGGYDVQTCEPTVPCGPNPGRREDGDTITYKFGSAVDPHLFFADWDGSGARTVNVSVNPDDPLYRYHDTLTVPSLAVPLLGTVDLGTDDYAGLFASQSYPSSSMTMDNDPLSPTYHRKVWITLAGGPTGSSNTGVTGVMVWTPSSAICSCSVTESGYPPDREF